MAELKRLASQAMDELLNLARQLRPTALDDHGLVPAIEAQLRGFGESTGVEAKLDTRGDPDGARRGEADGHLPRGPGGPHERRPARQGASRVDVELQAGAEGASCSVRDDGDGFDPVAARGTGTASGSRAWPSGRGWWAASSTCAPSPGAGTEVTLRLP